MSREYGEKPMDEYAEHLKALARNEAIAKARRIETDRAMRKNAEKANIGTAIRFVRKHRQLSQREVATSAGISRARLSDYEGCIVVPTIVTLMKLGGVLDIPWRQFICLGKDLDNGVLDIRRDSWPMWLIKKDVDSE